MAVMKTKCCLWIAVCAAACVALTLTTSALAAEKKTQYAKPYPLEECVVSGEKLGSMGEPFVFEHEGQQVKLCCKGCKKDFDANPKQFTAKIQEAAKKVKKYPAKTCIMSGEPLPADGPASIYKGQEFKFCCTDCQKKFDKEPARYAAKLPKN